MNAPKKDKGNHSQYRTARRTSLVILLMLVALMVATMAFATWNILGDPQTVYQPWDGVVEMGKLFGLPVGIMLACTVFFAVMERRSR